MSSPFQVLGGTGYVNEWSTDVWEEDHKLILQRCKQMMPSLAEVGFTNDSSFLSSSLLAQT